MRKGFVAAYVNLDARSRFKDLKETLLRAFERLLCMDHFIHLRVFEFFIRTYVGVGVAVNSNGRS